MRISGSLLVGANVTAHDRRLRVYIFLAWLALVAWFLSGHSFWRDEVRGFSLALSGSNFIEMLRNVHGEGHPAIWYLILRSLHDVFPYREVLPAAGAAIGIAAMAILTFLSPFRTVLIALVLFSYFGAFEYVVVARNYGLAALVMFALAALYNRIRDSLWFGLILAILANTNVPSCILAAMFLLFRFVELLTERRSASKQQWVTFAGNAVLAAAGALLCFITVYPTFNDAAVSPRFNKFGLSTLVSSMLDSKYGFHDLTSTVWAPLAPVLLLLSCFGLIRKPAAFSASLAGLIALKLFFFFVYRSYYRHEVLFIVFLLSLYWMVANGAGGRWPGRSRCRALQFYGSGAFILLVALQTALVPTIIFEQATDRPLSQSSNVGKLLKEPKLRRAIVMSDTDFMLETMPYYVNNDLWFARERRFGQVTHLTNHSRVVLSLDDLVADARQLHRRTGRPVLFITHLRLAPVYSDKWEMFQDTTYITPANVKRFHSSMRLIAKLRPARTDEDFDVYLYPR